LDWRRRLLVAQRRGLGEPRAQDRLAEEAEHLRGGTLCAVAAAARRGRAA
jgi:hypothetical protein